LRLHRSLRNYLLILDLQTLSPETAAAQTPRLSPRDLKESLKSGVNEALRRNGRVENVVLEVEEAMVAATLSDISLISEELVDNACKFSRKGTRIEVHFGPDAVLTITDAGRGMSAEEIAQVGSFQQFDRKKHEQQGLGLGLALVQKLAARSGATLTIASQPSQGTTVKVAFRPVTAAT